MKEVWLSELAEGECYDRDGYLYRLIRKSEMSPGQFWIKDMSGTYYLSEDFLMLVADSAKLRENFSRSEDPKEGPPLNYDYPEKVQSRKISGFWKQIWKRIFRPNKEMEHG